MPVPPSVEASLSAVQAFLDELATARPVPAGGAAAAVAIAFGASLAVMAARISGVEDTATRCGTLQRRALRLAAADCAAFSEVLAAKRRATPQADDKRFPWEGATRVPVIVAETAATVVAELDALRDIARSSLACDIGAARLLVIAGATASLANARENLVRVERDAVRSSLRTRIDDVGSLLAPPSVG